MIKEHREETGLTQSAAAELLDSDRVSISRTETGVRKGPLRGALQLLCAVWPELSEQSRDRVRRRLREWRGEPLQTEKEMEP